MNKNISGKFLTLILETKPIHSNNIFNTLQPQLCVAIVQAAIFPGIQKANESTYFGKVSL